MNISPDKSHAVLIDKETGKVHDLGEVTVTKLDGGPLLPDDVLPKGFDAQKSYTWTLKLSKRKGRKFEYAMKRLCMPPKRTYLSKREMIFAIHKISEEAKVGHIMESDEQLMRYSAKHLYAIFMHLYDKLKGGACHA